LDHPRILPSSPQILKQAQRAEFFSNLGAPESIISGESANRTGRSNENVCSKIVGTQDKRKTG